MKKLYVSMLLVVASILLVVVSCNASKQDNPEAMRLEKTVSLELKQAAKRVLDDCATCENVNDGVSMQSKRCARHNTHASFYAMRRAINEYMENENFDDTVGSTDAFMDYVDLMRKEGVSFGNEAVDLANFKEDVRQLLNEMDNNGDLQHYDGDERVNRIYNYTHNL